MTATIDRTSYGEILKEWESLYRQGAFMLARHELLEATERYPDSAEMWFLRAQTELAARDVRTARETFQKALEIVTDPRSRHAEGQSRRSAIEACLGPILESLEHKTLADGPLDPWRWLDDPQTVHLPNPALAGRMDGPLGRSEPFVSMQPVSALREHLAPIHIQRDSMRSLLGKDANLRIDKASLQLIDPSLHIERGLITIVDQSLILERPALPLGTVFKSVAPPFGQVAPPQPSRPIPAKPYPSPAQASPPPAPARDVRKPKPVPPKAVRAEPKPAADRWKEWEQRVEQLAESGNPAEALRMVDDAITRYPESSRLQEIKARILQGKGYDDQAAREWIETYRKAVEAGSGERATRAFSEATELAKENGDLLMDLAAIAISGGSVTMALAAGKLAADLYTRRNDRAKLTGVLQQLADWAPHDKSIRSELQELGSAFDSRVSEIREAVQETPTRPTQPPPHRQPRIPDHVPSYENKPNVAPPALPETRYDRTAPPQRRERRGPLSEEERRERALTLMTATSTEDAAKGESGGPDPGVFFLIGSIVILFLGLGGTPIPGFIGLVVSQKYLKSVMKKRPDESHMTVKVAKTLSILSIVAGIVF